MHLTSKYSLGWLLLFSLAFTLAACDSQEPDEEIELIEAEILDLSRPLQSAHPAAVGIDVSALDAAYRKARDMPNLRSLLVVRNGRLVGEGYFGDGGITRLDHVRSVTKSVISILIGQAIEQGLIEDTSTRLGTLISEEVAVLDSTEQMISVDHLLTMSSGFEWTEQGGIGFNDWVRAPDQITYLLDRPFASLPGQQFNYNSAAVHLLSVVLSEVTAGRTEDFAAEHLFNPLSISNFAWDVDARGYQNGGAGLQLRPRDIAKIGLLMLQDGLSGDTQVIAADWVRTSREIQVQIGFSFGPLQNVHYGYLWWLEHGQPDAAMLGWGYGGQFLYVVPDLELVIVTTAEYLGLGVPANQQEQEILDVIINYVLPAVQ